MEFINFLGGSEKRCFGASLNGHLFVGVSFAVNKTPLFTDICVPLWPFGAAIMCSPFVAGESGGDDRWSR